MCIGMNEKRISMVVKKREEKKVVRVMVCEYIGRVVDVSLDE
jgi:hypothetical protein